MDPFYASPNPNAVVPGYDDPIGRILFFVQIGRTNEAADLAEYWMRNAGWNNYEHALRLAQQREVGDNDPYLQIRQDYENEFEQMEEDFIMTMRMVQNGTIQRAKLDAWQQWFAANANRVALDARTFRQLNEARGTAETRDYLAKWALTDLTLEHENVGQVGWIHPPGAFADEENAPPVFAAPAPLPPRHRDVGIARWLHQL
jgi:hypothetical protein